MYFEATSFQLDNGTWFTVTWQGIVAFVDGLTRKKSELNLKDFLKRRSVMVAVIAPLLPNIVGSIFNIWYNFSNIKPLLTTSQMDRFLNAVTVYNLVVYPVLVSGVVFWAIPIARTRDRLLAGEAVDPHELLRSQQKVINLPWGLVTIGLIGWFSCIPVFLIVLNSSPEALNPHVLIHLPISFVIAGMIAVTQSLFVAEICSLRLLYPTFFPRGGAAKTQGAYTLGLTGKGMIWAASTVVCPVVSLLLLLVAPGGTQEQEWFHWFAISVSVVSISFGLISALLVGRLVTEPVNCLREAAQRVALGDLSARVEITRADDFGPLIDEFNRMVSDLNEKEIIEATFGRHVGQQAAREILAQDSQLAGQEKVISVMFVDLRNYTARSSDLAPHEVVQLLNVFLSHMVEIVEQNQGMVNKFLGDGFMALFGAGQSVQNHAAAAITAGNQMLDRMNQINETLGETGDENALAIGIGIHSGPAIVGSIGSNSRQEYTAIGDTVNVASRIESTTKKLGVAMLFSDATRALMDSSVRCQSLGPQSVKGKSQPIEVFACVSDLEG